MTGLSARTVGLIHAFDARITLSPPHDVGDGPYGRRQYIEVTSVVIDGEQLSGRLIGSAGDWMIMGPGVHTRMDVRLQIRTDDGAIVLAHYFGPAEANERMRLAMETSTPTLFADQRIRTHWLLEAGDPRYDWVNRSVFVGEGRFHPGEDGAAGFEHRVYRVD
ncbi:DUF3237 domain-containing protein [Methylobacterium sp. WL64]|uniref:DUF3237 domain-containing protein n=1 Tax=Methylobacterium sp. WL64 TaxID=2603894 RepID=UPI0011C8EE76|nr:DUF3237 domain-containing protein [Methylobacterium sp. WL64]TXN00742.1 DUF3237 domain-containing protein [Methylobacterium sp. WL64]